MNPNADFTELMLQCNKIKAQLEAHRALEAQLDTEIFQETLKALETELAAVEAMIWRDYWLA